MHCSMKKYVAKAIEKDKFIRDFRDDKTGMFIAESLEKNIENINHLKYQRTISGNSHYLSISDKNATTELIAYNSRRNYHCTCSNHKPHQKTVFLFGSKHNDGHLFGICSSCLLKLSLILLKYYIYNDMYTYEKSDTIRIEKAYKKSECYACRKKGEDYYRLKLNDKSIFLCKKCLDKFAEEILSTTTVKNLFYEIHHEFIKCKRARIKARKKAIKQNTEQKPCKS